MLCICHRGIADPVATLPAGLSECRLALTTRLDLSRFTFRSILYPDDGAHWRVAYWQRWSQGRSGGAARQPEQVAGFTWKSIVAGPLLLSGEPARILHPVPGVASLTWYEASGVTVDGSLWPVQRNGVVLGTGTPIATGYLVYEDEQTCFACLDTSYGPADRSTSVTLVAARSWSSRIPGTASWHDTHPGDLRVNHLAARLRYRVAGACGGAASIWSSWSPVSPPGWLAHGGLVIPDDDSASVRIVVAAMMLSPSFRLADCSTLPDEVRVTCHAVADFHALETRADAEVTFDQPGVPDSVVVIDARRLETTAESLKIDFVPTGIEIRFLPRLSVRTTWSKRDEPAGVAVRVAAAFDERFQVHGDTLRGETALTSSLGVQAESISFATNASASIRWQFGGDSVLTLGAAASVTRDLRPDAHDTLWSVDGHVQWGGSAPVTRPESTGRSGSR